MVDIFTKDVTKEIARQTVVDFLKEKKNIDNADINSIENKDGVWLIRGTCPIDLQGHPWTEKFEVEVDLKGRVKSTDFSLL